MYTVAGSLSLTGGTFIRKLDSVVLTCRVHGFPAPAISWYWQRDEEMDVSLSSGNNTFIVDEYNSDTAIATSVLTITEALSTNGGQYVCEANNSLSQANRLSGVSVQIPSKHNTSAPASSLEITQAST